MSRRALFLLLALPALWGASYMFIKVALDDVSPGGVVFARLLLGALALWPIALYTGALKGARARLPQLTVVSIVQIMLPVSLIAIGEQWIPSSLAGVLNGTVPIFVALLAIGMDRSERPAGAQIAGIGFGFLGVAVVLGLDVERSALALVGALALLLSSVGYAVGPLYAKRRLSGLEPVGIAALLLTIGAIATLPWALLTAPSAAPSAGALGSLVVLGVGGTGLAFAMYYALMQEIGPGRASVVAYLVPGFAVIYGAVGLDEPVGLGTALGLALILCGSWLVARGRTAGWRRVKARPATAAG